MSNFETENESSESERLKEIDEIRLGRANNLRNISLPKALQEFQEKQRLEKEERKRWALLKKNVFQCSDEMSSFEVMKLGFGVFLALPRFIATLIIVLGFQLLLGLTSIPFDSKKPYPDYLLKTQDWLMYIAGNLLALTNGLIVTTKGKPCSPDEALVQVMCPHSTFFDPIVTTIAANGAVSSYVAKAELEKIGFLQAWMQGVFVNRTNSTSRKSAGDALFERATNRKWKRKVSIFPEGTCGNRTGLLRFAAGAFRPGAPVQPVIIRWDNELSWTSGSQRRGLLFLRSLGELYHCVEVEFLPVYVPSEEEKEHPDFYAANVRDLCARELELPVTMATFTDRGLAKIVAKKKIAPGKVLDFYYEDVVSAIRSKNIKLNRTDFPYNDQQLHALVKIEMTNLVSIYVDYCNKDGKMTLSQFEFIQKLPEPIMKKLVKNTDELEAKTNIKLLSGIQWSYLRPVNDEITFRKLSILFFNYKYTSSY